MNKTIKWIVIGCVVALLCIAAFFIVQLIPKPEPLPEDSGVGEDYVRDGQSIYTVAAANVDSVEVWNENDTFSVRLGEDGNAVIVGREGVPVLTASVNGLYESVQDIRVESVIASNVQDLSDYGLQEPQVTLTVHKTGTNADDVFYLGDKTPDGDAYYFCKSDSRDVFAVSTYFAERLLKTRSDYYSAVISAAYAEEDFVSLGIEYPNAENNIFVRMCTQEEIDSKQYESTMIMTSPFTNGADSDTIRADVATVRNLNATRIVDDDPADLSVYGLDQPIVVKITVDIDKTQALIDNITNTYYDPSAEDGDIETVTMTYRVGSKGDNERYVMYGDANVVYAVESSCFDFAEQPVDHFCQRLISIRYLKDLNYFTVERDGVSYRIDVSVTTEDDKTTYAGSYQGRTLDGPSMQNLYKQIIGLSNYGMGEDPQTEPMMTIVLHGKDGVETKMEFLPINEDELYAFARVDGGGRFLILTSKLDIIWQNTQTLITGGKVSA